MTQVSELEPDLRAIVPLPGRASESRARGAQGRNSRVSVDGAADVGPTHEPSPPLWDVSFVVLDVETTGGSTSLASLTEVAAALYRRGECIGTFRTFVRPDERIPPYITLLTGISDEMVADAPSAGAMLPSLLEFLGSSVLVGHNVRFDLSFINHALLSTGRNELENPTIDTLAMARRLIRDETPNCKLSTLAAVLRLDHRPSHRALADVLATGDLLHALLERAGTFGIVDLSELLSLPRLLGHPQAHKLKTTATLPTGPGVYWFADGRGRPLFVEYADNLRAAARTHFLVQRSRRTARILRQMQSVGHRSCPDQPSAIVLERRLVQAWDPPFNRVRTEPGARRAPARRAPARRAPVPRG